MKMRQFSQQDIEMVKEEIAYQGHFTMKKMHFRHKLFNGGMSRVIVRELMIKGAASALIAYDPIKDAVVLVEQVRIGAYDPKLKSSPWLIELVAGMIDTDESPAEVAMREGEEEAGLHISEVEHALSVWDSPGGAVERLHLFLGLVDSSKVNAERSYGLDEEGEDIKVHIVSREQAYQWVQDGTIDNVIAVLGLQWLQLNYQKYRK